MKRQKPKAKTASTALAVRPAEAVPETPLAIIERVARDKSIDVAKMTQLIELQKEMMRIQAKIDFDEAFARMWPELPVIIKRGKIQGKNRPTIPFARLGEDIQPVIKPILARHGFSIRYRTLWPSPDRVKVIGILQRGGHRERSTFEGPADASDYRSHVQSLGSTIQYGRRYTAVDLLSLTVQGLDDDGTRSPARSSEPVQERERPVAHHGWEDEPITQKQRQRLVMIAKNAGRSWQNEVVGFLRLNYGIGSSKLLKRKDYEAVCAAVEAPGELVTREPGEDG